MTDHRERLFIYRLVLRLIYPYDGQANPVVALCKLMKWNTKCSIYRPLRRRFYKFSDHIITVIAAPACGGYDEAGDTSDS